MRNKNSCYLNTRIAQAFRREVNATQCFIRCARPKNYLRLSEKRLSINDFQEFISWEIGWVLNRPSLLRESAIMLGPCNFIRLKSFLWRRERRSISAQTKRKRKVYLPKNSWMFRLRDCECIWIEHDLSSKTLAWGFQFSDFLWIVCLSTTPLLKPSLCRKSQYARQPWRISVWDSEIVNI